MNKKQLFKVINKVVMTTKKTQSLYICVCVSDLIAKQDGESFARGGVADNDVGLWAASFFFSPRFFLFFLLH